MALFDGQRETDGDDSKTERGRESLASEERIGRNEKKHDPFSLSISS